MIEADKRKAVFLLHQEGMSIREIARRLQLSRNTVRTILKQQGEMPTYRRKHKVRIEAELLERLYRSEEHTSELQSHHDLVCRLLLEKKKIIEIRNRKTRSPDTRPLARHA